MKKLLREYKNESITVEYDFRRCIHVGECLAALPEVFDRSKKPWVMVDNADADAIAEAVLRCPSGALHFTRHDGGLQEETPAHNAVRLITAGPLYLTGDIEVIDAKGETILEDTRVSLCRCGHSGNMPVCDNSHQDIEFRAGGLPDDRELTVSEGEPGEGRLRVYVTPDGPYNLLGPVDLQTRRGEAFFRGVNMELCRCGGSSNKPFCDWTHKQIDFHPDSTPQDD